MVYKYTRILFLLTVLFAVSTIGVKLQLQQDSTSLSDGESEVILLENENSQEYAEAGIMKSEVFYSFIPQHRKRIIHRTCGTQNPPALPTSTETGFGTITESEGQISSEGEEIAIEIPGASTEFTNGYWETESHEYPNIQIDTLPEHNRERIINYVCKQQIENIIPTFESEIETPWTEVETPLIEVETPWAEVETPLIEVETPWTEVETPLIEVETPWTEVETSWTEVEIPWIKGETSWTEVNELTPIETNEEVVITPVPENEEGTFETEYEEVINEEFEIENENIIEYISSETEDHESTINGGENGEEHHKERIINYVCKKQIENTISTFEPEVETSWKEVYEWKPVETSDQIVINSLGKSETAESTEFEIEFENEPESEPNANIKQRTRIIRKICPGDDDGTGFLDQALILKKHDGIWFKGQQFSVKR